MEDVLGIRLASTAAARGGMSRARMDGDLLAAIYEREVRYLIGMLWVFTGDKAQAEDVAQEAFVRLATSWHRMLDPNRATSYLRSIAFNLARSEFRRAEVAQRHREVAASAPSARGRRLAERIRTGNGRRATGAS